MNADVIIVGAGPAGSTCARLLADRKHRVLLLDRSRFPRDKPCGGWVNLKVFEEFPELEKLRNSLGPRDRLVEEPFRGLVFHNSDFSREAVFSSRGVVGYTVLRKQFDKHLLRLAAERDDYVQVVERQEVVAVEMGEQGVVAVTRSGRRFEGRILVGADGAHSTIARLTGLSEGWPADRQIVCLVKEIEVDGRTLDRTCGKQRKIHICIGYRGLAGYAWAFPKRNTINVGIGCRADAAPELDAVYARWVADLQRGGLLPEKAGAGKPVAGMVPAGGAIEYEGHVGKRVLLIGDAGGFVSAASGEGIYPAMLSARVAATCLDQALRAAQPQDVLMDFKFAWRQAFAEYIQMPNANLALLLPLIYDNQELCNRLAQCYLFGKNF